MAQPAAAGSQSLSSRRRRSFVHIQTEYGRLESSTQRLLEEQCLECGPFVRPALREDVAGSRMIRHSSTRIGFRCWKRHQLPTLPRRKVRFGWDPKSCQLAAAATAEAEL
eukprot:2596361-Rhodomonas_salina.1